MNGLVGKEIRAVLPVWLLAMVLAIVPIWIVWPSPGAFLPGDLGTLVFAPFGLGVLLLSLTPFGQELNWGTFAVLLSQPVSRRRIWLVKILVVAVALSLAFLAFCISNHLRVESTLESMKHTVWRNAFERPSDQTQFFAKVISDTRRGAALDTLFAGGLEVLAGFAGGLWTTLLFCQVTAAFWLTFLVPMGLTVLAASFLRSLPDPVARVILAIVLGAYSTAGFFWARRFFLHVQDTQWTGGVVALPSWREAPAEQGAGTVRRAAKPVRALLQKEFQAQQVNMLLAGGLLVMHLGVIAVRHLGAEYMATHQSIAMVLEMVPLLWLVMPLLIGSVAVAEERKLGMFQSTLCLPASRGVQFGIKLLLALVLGLLFGGVLPLAVERLAPHTSVAGTFTGMSFLGDIHSMDFVQLAGSLGLSLLAFYGSTLTRNALQGMGAGLLGALAAGVVIFAAQHAGETPEFFLWTGPLIAWIGYPVMLVTVLVLAYRNYGKLQPDIRTWFGNGTRLLLTLVCVAAVTTTVYHRAWEAWIPEEPPHKYTIMGQNLMGQRSRVPGPRQSNRNAAGYLGINLQDLTPKLAQELNLQQTNGALVGSVTAGGPGEQAGLHVGDLVRRFNNEEMPDSKQLALAVAKTPPDSEVPVEIIRRGLGLRLQITVGRQPDLGRRVRQSRAGCKIVAADSQMAVLLPDRRLWLRQRPIRLIQRSDIQRGIIAWYANGPSHTSFQAGSDWKDVAITIGGCFALKADGTLWEVSATQPGETAARRVGEDHDWAQIAGAGEHFCALKTDGTLWQWGWKQSVSEAKWMSPVKVGADDDWVAVGDSWPMSAAIKTDGSVWRWGWKSKGRGQPVKWLDGACTDPISFAVTSKAVAMVCADGTLWIGGELLRSVYEGLSGYEKAERASREMVRWGNDSDWQEIQFVSWGKAVGIKRGGSLWEWDVTRGFDPVTASAIPPSMPSRYDDWMSVANVDNAFLALARDGSLCLWGDLEGRGYITWNGLPDPHRLLMPSRIKATRVADLAQ